MSYATKRRREASMTADMGKPVVLEDAQGNAALTITRTPEGYQLTASKGWQTKAITVNCEIEQIKPPAADGSPGVNDASEWPHAEHAKAFLLWMRKAAPATLNSWLEAYKDAKHEKGNEA
jgi:hypothetical protein